MNKRVTAGIFAAALFIGGAGTTLILPSIVNAADPTASPAAAATTSSTSGSSGTDLGAGCANHGGPGGLDADDLTAAAQALGMTETDLTTALRAGQTAADVAASKGVDVQKVVAAIVAADKAEFAAVVTAGTMTQAQADQLTANLTAHVTDEVNGVAGGPGGHGHGPIG